MTVAEVRTLWQRTTNQCFVQEDAKRAPKLACSQSSCAVSKPIDAGPASGADESNYVNVNAMPFNRKSSFSNLSSDSRWWLRSQPNYWYQKCSIYESLNSSLVDEMETLKSLDGNETCEREVTQYGNESYDSSYYMHCDFQNNGTKKVHKDKIEEDYCKNCVQYSELSDMMSEHETIDIDHMRCSVSKKTNDLCLGSDYSWIEDDRTEPLWQTTDSDESAVFVSEKSLNHFENCDLTPPQKKYLRCNPCSADANANELKTKTTSFDCEAKSRGFSNLSVHAQGCLNPNPMHGTLEPSDKEEISLSASDKPHRTTGIRDSIMEKQLILEGDPSKAKLMEALCHSQKRAREAEEAARQVCAENEHLVKLVFNQASQIFAYKQWLQVLQLEALYYLVNKVNSKDQEKQEQEKHDVVATYAGAIALGLSLAGAGIILKCTVGWKLPHL